jgi:hypothetical protein
MHRTQRIHSIPLERDSFSTQRFVILHAYAMLLKYALATHLQTHFRRFPMNYRLRQQQTTQHNTHSQQNIHNLRTKFSIANLSPIHTRCSVTSDLIPLYTQRFLPRLQHVQARPGIGWRTSKESQCIASRRRCVIVSPLSGEPTANPVRMLVRPLVSYLLFADRSPRYGRMNDCSKSLNCPRL